MRHALEADHLAAVASLATRGASHRRSTVLRGVAWGVGHTLALLAVGGACLALRLTISTSVSRWLEFGVGLMLLGLGAEIVWRWRRYGVHVHLHRHGDDRVHVHAHSHAPEEREAHDPSHHTHTHARV